MKNMFVARCLNPVACGWVIKDNKLRLDLSSLIGNRVQEFRGFVMIWMRIYENIAIVS